ncbi:MAG: pyridoxal phosphate-dependent decarboxylase family protein [Anaerolineae bacterium]|jgi:glutamate/tyrosine decarboxylase-like PLP-dependent enzyme
MSQSEELALSSEEMRELGYRVVDLIVEHFETLSEKPVTRRSDRASLEASLRQPCPEGGADPLAVLERLKCEVLDNIMHLDHPRFFAFVPSPSSFVGAMADALASGFNVFAGTWLEASGPAQIELVAIDWLREACGLPATAGGLFVSGGSMANITALAVARQVRLGNRMEGAVVYGSDQTHSSIQRGLMVLGFESEQFHVIPSDGQYRLDPAGLRRAIQADRAAGRIPFCVVANAGTTNTGAVDPLRLLAELCREEGLWLHADGAYGAAAVFCDRGRALLEGLDRVDSLAVDPHKWLFQPYEAGCVLVRNEPWLRETFHILPEYMEDTVGREGEVNFCDRGIQLTRGFRALKLWMSFQVFGRAGFEAAIRRGFELAEGAEAAVRGLSGWQVVTPAQMGVVTFRCVPQGMPAEQVDRLNRRLVDALIADGFAMVSSTVLRGQTVLRLCTINPRTTEDELLATLGKLDRLAGQV